MEDGLDGILQEQEEQHALKDLEVEIIHQRIVFLIPALPPRPAIDEEKRTQRREGQRRQEQHQRDRDAAEESNRRRKKKSKKKKRKKEKEKEKKAIDPVRFPGPSSVEERIRASYLRKRVERRGGLRLWLGSKGLERFARLFQEHEIDVGKLSHLTMDALKQIGVLPVGPRRKLISAIQKLCI